MISSALQFVRDTMDQFLKNKFGLDESRVVLNNLIESNGSVPATNQNKITISLINIEKETNRAFYIRNKKTNEGDFKEINPDERYNLDLLISSNFDDYAETLRFLNGAMLFFQVNNRLEASSFSTIPAGITRLDFDVEKINYVQMQGLWTSMGAKYVPSIIYKMRLISIQGDEAEGFPIAASQISNRIAV